MMRVLSRRLNRHVSSALLAAAIALGGLGMTGCSTNPATGQRAFTLLSPDDEQELGREQHPKILAEFGGAYEDPATQTYVTGIGNALVARSEFPGVPFTFTVLDSPVVNAFALPGGYVYITRGLMALANSEAELAGVVGHEIGHVTARHGAQQHGRSVLVGLGAGILGAVIGDRGVAQVLNTGGGLILRGYSREQEFEADSLGLRYMTQAGYDPGAMASFLEHLRAKSKLDSQLLGSGSDPDEHSLLSTHPRTIDRVQEARTAALGAGPLGGRTEQAAYLRRLDGMIYDDSPEQGFVRGQRFVHPKLRFEFSVPGDFTLLNGPTAVRARGPNGAVIVFDMAPKATGGTMLQYIRQQWGARLPLADLSALNVNGMEAATGIARISANQGPFDLRLVAIRGHDDRIYRLLFGTPADHTSRLNTALQRTTFSFREISEAEAAKEKPYRLRLYEARAGDSVARLAQWMPQGPQPEARFRVLNGLAPGEEPVPGQLLKYVSY